MEIHKRVDIIRNRDWLAGNGYLQMEKNAILYIINENINDILHTIREIGTRDACIKLINIKDIN